MHQQIVRLIVLFEDLRIEWRGVAEERISTLDITSEKLRSLYFLRRSIATLYEFQEAVERLQEDLHWLTLLDSNSLGRDYFAAKWNEAVAFFANHRSFIARLRNNIGGHFGESPAIYVVKHSDADSGGSVELDVLGENAALFLPIAGQIAAIGVLQSLPGTHENEEKYDEMVNIVIHGWQHASEAARAVVGLYVWPKLESSDLS
jgi:hypothetical protein